MSLAHGGCQGDRVWLLSLTVRIRRVLLSAYLKWAHMGFNLIEQRRDTG
jgi:hypothetical protein